MEAQLRGIYKANFGSSSKLDMKIYFKLNSALRLDLYRVTFNLYPWLDSFAPFSNWASSDF